MSLTLILGGARSGKSNFALSLAKDKREVTFVATALPLDEEMKERIERHKRERPLYWKTVEEPLDLLSVVKDLDSEIIILDCLTMWVSNLLERHIDEEIIGMAEDIAEYCRKFNGEVIAISNEVGLGIVPEYPLGRRYRDLLGKVNQVFARYSNKVFFMIAGIPLEVKDESK
ncbi:MAG: bifunctional adenosylcobinamide kinase/adenosylcobinamide-phosphate guanylyltransferase [bacterium]|nr:bifunctional adenosylcobinamide kinase/adenosylcobinamide-phosphate guanylyltransferase [bacterium]